MLGLITQARARDLLSWLCICHRQQGRISRIHCSGVKLLFAGVRKFEKSGGQRAAFVMKSCRENPRSARIEFHRSSTAAGGQCNAMQGTGFTGGIKKSTYSVKFLNWMLADAQFDAIFLLCPRPINSFLRLFRGFLCLEDERWRKDMFWPQAELKCKENECESNDRICTRFWMI